MQEKWGQIQSILENNLASGLVKAWIGSLSPSWEDGGLALYAQTEFAAAQIRAWYGRHITKAVTEVCGPDCRVRVLAGAAGAKNAAGGTVHTVVGRTVAVSQLQTPSQFQTALPDIHGAERAASCPAPAEKKALPSGAGTVRALPSPKPLPAVQLALPSMAALSAPESRAENTWRYSFDDFVVGPSNELAHAASKSICSDYGQPGVLFLSSAPGLGKTHLVHAVGRALTAICNRSRPRVEYLTAEEFASRFYFSLKGHETERFKSHYRSLDLLLLEDVHFLQGKEKMQDELLATIKALSDRGGRVVFSSSFAPRDLKQMDDHLMSRFSAGLLSFIVRPDEDTRRRILRSKASLHQVILPGEVEDMLAHYIHADVRQIESCLQTLILKARLLNSNITPEMAWEVIAQYGEHSPVLDIEAIIGQVCRGFALSREQLLSASRKHEYVSARNTAYFLARKHTDLSLEAIGRRFNRRHSTVIKGITSLEREMRVKSPTGQQIGNVLRMIEQTGNIVAPGR